MRGRIAGSVLISLLIFAAAGCDSFSLLEHFNKHDGLSVALQKKSISTSEGTKLYPSGGTEPYTFAVIEEDSYYSGVGAPGSITDQQFTAMNFVGKVKIRLTDANGYSVDSTLTIIPPQPQDFVVDGATGANKINVSWTYSNMDMISGFRIDRSKDYEPFVKGYATLGKVTGFSEDNLNQTIYYAYRIYAVAGEYESRQLPEEGAYPNS